MKRAGFTTIEIVIVLVIIGLLSSLGLFVYTQFAEKAKNTEVIIAAGNIREAEIAHKIDKGEYVQANNVEEINDLLSLSISPKNYNYRVVGVSDQDFMVLANKIDTDQIILAMNKDGLIRQGYGSSSGSGSSSAGSGGSSSSGGSGISSSGSGSGSGGSGISSSGSGSSSGGSGGSSSGGGGSSGSGGSSSGGGGSSAVSTSVNLDNTGGGWSNLAANDGSGAIIDAALQDAINLLKNSTSSSYAFSLIEAKDITVEYVALGAGIGALWSSMSNTIKVNNIYSSSTAALAALIAHEATHADYDYYTDFWISNTKSLHSELTDAEISAPDNSVNQEYDCFCNQMEAWRELKSGSDSNNDAWLSVYNQGEDYMRSVIRSTYLSIGQDLPEY